MAVAQESYLWGVERWKLERIGERIGRSRFSTLLKRDRKPVG